MKAGWNWITGAHKWHYFGEDGRSLCGKYLKLFGNDGSEDSRDDHPDSCRACVRKVSKYREEQGQDGSVKG